MTKETHLSDLAPCPFCEGSPAEIAPVEMDNTWVVECTDCAAVVVFDSRPHAPYRIATHAEAVAAWNRRPASSTEREAALTE